MRKAYSIIMAAIIAFFFTIAPAPYAQASAVGKIDYVALGDSLATGQTPYKTIGKGFTDMISEELAEAGVLSSFTKEHAASGETSVGLLEKLKREGVQKSIQEAELVTIISGANDILQAVDFTSDIDQEAIMALLHSISVNLTVAVKGVKAINPDAEIYLYGYYFPFPYMEEGLTRAQLIQALEYFNYSIKTVAELEGIHFVEVSSAFNPNSLACLPNPQDIHPNEEGYQVLADQFFLNYEIPSIIDFPNPDGEWGKVIHKLEPSVSDKMWTVELNKEVNSDSVSVAIYVVKDRTELIEVETEVSEDKKHIFVKAPQQGYEAGTYQLMITGHLKDTADNPIKTTVLMEFTVQ
ncbi:GDSL-type esterase/lipase family protein [Bacillus dakarensis]|uniref:GDSL-type esterase/lipase family protein n=1 Tax=Robertmurraya dakarensis TaxID=1926278 RepID=UPI000981EF01|nr:GDSL-type esterase/lipase family protein [Bacillus dakarensis]